MVNRNKYRIARSVMIFVFICSIIFILFCTIGMVFYISDQKDYYSESYRASKGNLDGDVTIENIGSMYEGNADAGYSFYRIGVPIYNSGNDNFYSRNNLYCKVEGEEYDDVMQFYSSSSDNYFTNEYTEMIPSGQSGVAYYIVEVKDGVQQVTFTYYADSSDYYDEVSGESQTLMIPGTTL